MPSVSELKIASARKDALSHATGTQEKAVYVRVADGSELPSCLGCSAAAPSRFHKKNKTKKTVWIDYRSSVGAGDPRPSR